MKRFRFLLLIGALSLSVSVRTSLAQNDDLFELKKNFEIFGQLYEEIVINYVDHVRPEPFMGAGISAMLEQLDPYTRFYDQADNVDMDLLRKGSLADVGLNIGMRRGSLTVLEPGEGSSAYQRGVRTGDVILRIDGTDVTDMTVRDVSGLLVGDEGTTVDVSIRRVGFLTPLDFVLRRTVRTTQNVSFVGYLNDDTTAGIGFVKLNQFGRRSGREVRRSFRDLFRSGGLKAAILDLRDNPGGILSEAIEIVELFVPLGSLVVSTRGRQEGMSQTYVTSKEPLFPDIPVVVLINEYSASASEIVAGALQDLDRAVILGNRSFGKGLVQIVRSLPYNTSMKITVAHYYTPSGRNIQSARIISSSARISTPDIQLFRTSAGRDVRSGIGIEPDVVMDTTPTSELETALERAGAIFRFANDYSARSGGAPDEIPSLESGDLMNSFRDWLARGDFTFKSSSELLLDSLSVQLTASGYEGAESRLASVRSLLRQEKERDFDRYSDRIVRRLSSEILARYLPRSELIRRSLQTDAFVLEASALTKDRTAYDQLLTL